MDKHIEHMQRAFSRWHLTAAGEAFQTRSSVLQPVFFQGMPAMLKIVQCEEERRGCALMHWWKGEGAARVLAYAQDALLLERSPGKTLRQAMHEGCKVEFARAGLDSARLASARLASAGQDSAGLDSAVLDRAVQVRAVQVSALHNAPRRVLYDDTPKHVLCDAAASRVLCQVAARLHAPRAQPLPELLPLAQWFAALSAAGTTQGGIFTQAATLAQALLAAPQELTVLHGDLHHGNILDGGERGWLAIDPKGLWGERAFDFANLFCNPDHATATRAGRLEKQVAIVCAAAQLEAQRLLAWITAWAGLSALWHIEDGQAPDTALAVADAAWHARGGGNV